MKIYVMKFNMAIKKDTFFQHGKILHMKKQVIKQLNWRFYNLGITVPASPSSNPGSTTGSSELERLI